MKFSKIILTLAVFSFAVSTVFVVPMANVKADDEITQENTITGKDSFNKNKTKVKRFEKTVKVKKAKVKNKVRGTANTGGHEVKNNTTAGDVDSGKVTGNVTLANDVNQDGENGDCCCGDEGVTDVDIDQTNDTTGNNSVNINKAKVKDVDICKDIKKAKVKNKVNLTGNTGGHVVNGNTTVGNVDSGDVSFTIGITNTVN